MMSDRELILFGIKEFLEQCKDKIVEINFKGKSYNVDEFKNKLDEDENFKKEVIDEVIKYINEKLKRNKGGVKNE